MKVICIHVYDIDKDIPLTVQVGGIYTVLSEGESITGFKYYEFTHQPGIGYDRKCFVPLEGEDLEELEKIEELTPSFSIKIKKSETYDSYPKGFAYRII